MKDYVLPYTHSRNVWKPWNREQFVNPKNDPPSMEGVVRKQWVPKVSKLPCFTHFSPKELHRVVQFGRSSRDLWPVSGWLDRLHAAVAKTTASTGDSEALADFHIVSYGEKS